MRDKVLYRGTGVVSVQWGNVVQNEMSRLCNQIKIKQSGKESSNMRNQTVKKLPKEHSSREISKHFGLVEAFMNH